MLITRYVNVILFTRSHNHVFILDLKMRSLSLSSLSSVQRNGFQLGQRDDGDFKARAKSAAFKLLSALVKDNNHVKLAIFDHLVEFFQLLSICFIGPWGPLGDKIFHVLIWSQLETVFLEYHIPELSVAVRDSLILDLLTMCRWLVYR